MYARLRREAQRMLEISWETAVRNMPAARFPTHLLLCVHCLPAFITAFDSCGSIGPLICGCRLVLQLSMQLSS